MKLDQLWITYSTHYATGEGMHHVVSIATSAERAARLFEERAADFFRRNATTSRFDEALETCPALRGAIPKEVLRRTSDPACWSLEYFGTLDFNCG